MILFELSPFAKEIVEKTNEEFAYEPINNSTNANLDNRINSIERKLEEIGVDPEEKSLFMRMYTRAISDALRNSRRKRGY